MDFNTFFAMGDNGESSANAAARQSQEAALWEAAAAFSTDYGAQQQQHMYAANAGLAHQSFPTDIQMFSPTAFSTGAQSTLAERPSQHLQMGPPRRKDHGPDRKRAKTGRDSELDSVEYWTGERGEDEDPSRLDRSFEISFAHPARFQPRPPPIFNPMSTIPGLGTGQYTESVTNLIRPDDFIMDDSALDNALSEDDDLVDTMNLNEQLSQIDSMPPNPANLPPRENLYSTPLSWEKPTVNMQQNNPAASTNTAPANADTVPTAPSTSSTGATNPAAAPSTSGASIPSSSVGAAPSVNPQMVNDFANTGILSEAEQRRLLAIAMNGNRPQGYSGLPFGTPFGANAGPPFLGNLGVAMMTPATAQLFEQAFSMSSFSDLNKTPTASSGSFMQQQQQIMQQQQQAQQQQQQNQQNQQGQQKQGQPPDALFKQEANTPPFPSDSPTANSMAMSAAASASINVPPFSTLPSDTASTEQQQQTAKHGKAPDRTAHNDIERKYRTNLKDKISELRDAVPALKGLVDEEEDDGNIRPQKVSKGTVLTKATEYIHYLERRNKSIMKEHQDLSRRLQAFEQLLNATARQPFLMPSYSRSMFDPRGFC